MVQKTAEKTLLDEVVTLKLLTVSEFPLFLTNLQAFFEPGARVKAEGNKEGFPVDLVVTGIMDGLREASPSVNVGFDDPRYNREFIAWKVKGFSTLYHYDPERGMYIVDERPFFREPLSVHYSRNGYQH